MFAYNIKLTIMFEQVKITEHFTLRRLWTACRLGITYFIKNKNNRFSQKRSTTPVARCFVRETVFQNCLTLSGA